MGLATTEIDRASLARTVTVIHLVFVGQTHTGMVAVVSNLVVQFAGGRVHAVQPVEAPFYFVYDVGNTVGTGKSGCIVGITERYRIFLIGKHHLVDGICGSSGVLQVIGSIVPAAADVYVLSCLGGVIQNIAVVYMATVFQERVVAATLLAHVVQQEVGGAVVHVVVDREIGRNGFARFQIISSRLVEITEIQSIGTFHKSHLSGGFGGGEGTDGLSGESVYQCILLYVSRFFTHEYCHFYSLRQVAKLVNTYPCICFYLQDDESECYRK